MAPKKNAFSAFLIHYKNQEMKKGKQTPSFQELSIKLIDTWNSMSTDEKNYYKSFACKLNKNRKKNYEHEQISNLLNCSFDFWTMKNDIKKKFDDMNSTEELLNQKFILFHINSHSHVEEQYYFPAEIAALEFCLKDGVTRRYHQFIGISNIYPRGFAGSMREYSEKFHQIHCWEEHWDDYENILLEFINFLKDESKDNIHLYDGEFNLPYIFTTESEPGNDMMKMKSSLEKLYVTVLPDHSEKAKSVFKIGCVEELLGNIIKKMKIHLDYRTLATNASVYDILEADMYGRGLGCVYHHIRDIEFKCSKARILQWLSNICKYVNEYTNLPIKPGKHFAGLLIDGSRRIFDTRNEHIPITAYDLIMDKINLSTDFRDIFDNESSETSTTLDENEEFSSDDFEL